jgi:hypothetical protein
LAIGFALAQSLAALFCPVWEWFYFGTTRFRDPGVLGCARTLLAPSFGGGEQA